MSLFCSAFALGFSLNDDFGSNFLIVLHKGPLSCKGGGHPAEQPEEIFGKVSFSSLFFSFFEVCNRSSHFVIIYYLHKR